MKLKTLIIKNFKGIKDLAVEMNGKDIVIKGRNGAGKSSVGQAFLWMLTGKDLSFNKASVKPVNEDGSEVHLLDTVVEGIFTDGSTLKRTQVENWVKKRGAVDKVLSGNIEKFHINDVPVKAGEWKDQISEIFGSEETLKLQSNPFFFSKGLSWQDRRKVIIGLVGDLTDEEVVASDVSLNPLTERLLAVKSVENIRRTVDEKLKQVSSDIKSIPAKIEEAARYMPDLRGMTILEATKKKNDLLEQGRELKGRLEVLKSSVDTTALDEIINNATIRYENIKHGHQLEIAEKINSTFKREVELKHIVSLGEKAAQRKEDVRRDLLFSADVEKAATCTVLTCDTCGQKLTKELADEVLSKEAATRKELFERLTNEHDECSKVVDHGEAAKAELEEIKKRKRLLSSEKSPAGMEAERKIIETAKVQKEEALSGEVAIEITNMEAALRQLRILHNDASTDIDNFARKSKIEERVTELKNEEKTLASEWESLEIERTLIDKFTVRKIELLEGKIKEAIAVDGLDVAMFRTQVNGGISEICELTFNGVPFSQVNLSEQIRIGMNLIGRLSEQSGVEIPVFIDNSEACNYLPEVPYQVIRLEVSDDETLTVKEGK